MATTETVTVSVQRGWAFGTASVDVEMRSGTLLGFATLPYPGSGLDHGGAVSAFEETLGRARLLRTFDGGKDADGRAGLLPATWNDRSGPGSIAPGLVPGADRRGSWHSLKVDVRRLASGEMDEAVWTYLKSIPITGHPRLLTLWHEPSDEIRDGLFGADDWYRANVRFASIVRQVNHPDVKFGPIFTSKWALGTRFYDVPALLLRGGRLLDLIDFIGWDPYHEASKTGNYGPSVRYYLDPIVAWCRIAAPHLPIAIGETGVVPNPADPGYRGRWLKDFVNYAEAERFPFVCYFDCFLNGGTPWKLREFPDGTPDPHTINVWRELAAR